MKGKLIVFEGIDGVGKTTLAHALKDELTRQSIKVVCYEDIEDKNAGYNKIKFFIKQLASTEASLLFYLSSAIYKSGAIRKLLKTQWVICDRYIYSTLAFHKIRGVDAFSLLNLNALSILWPDYYFLVKVDEAVRVSRITKRQGSIKDDLIPKKPGSLVAKMEKELERLKPIIIDNSSSSIDRSIEKIIKLIAIR